MNFSIFSSASVTNQIRKYIYTSNRRLFGERKLVDKNKYWAGYFRNCYYIWNDYSINLAFMSQDKKDRQLSSLNIHFVR